MEGYARPGHLITTTANTPLLPDEETALNHATPGAVVVVTGRHGDGARTKGHKEVVTAQVASRVRKLS